MQHKVNFIILTGLRKYCIFIVLIFLFTGCYKETEFYSNDIVQLNFYMSNDQELKIYNSRNTVFEIENPKPDLYINDLLYKINTLSLRGHTSLDFRRKSYNVSSDVPVILTNKNVIQGDYPMRKYKLLALATDYTYIENRIAQGFLKILSLQPLFHKFVEVSINNNTQGVYMLIEDPDDYILEKNHYEFIIRRDYKGTYSKFKYQPQEFGFPQEKYFSNFYRIYQSITEYNGKQLYDTINKRLNIKQYMQKIAVDYLLMNGDYTDEIYLYSGNSDSLRFNIIPWDYDDIFQSEPHELQVKWGTGTLFGKREYNNRQDIINDIGVKHIFSIEDDIDYIVAKDPYLYSAYIKELKYILTVLNNEKIDQVFEETLNELIPFYDNLLIIEQSKYDRDETDYSKFISNLDSKKILIKNRRNDILNNLSE